MALSAAATACIRHSDGLLDALSVGDRNVPVCVGEQSCAGRLCSDVLDVDVWVGCHGRLVCVRVCVDVCVLTCVC